MHGQQQDGQDLQTAFALLASLVSEMHAQGRRTYSASVKPELRARTNGGFDEHKIGPGFPSFRAFLAAAADAGVVTVQPAPAGPDVEVLPLGAESLGPKRPARDGASERIRGDFWKAFVDWSPNKLRAFDRTTGRAVMVSAEPAPLEPTRQTKLRLAVQTDPNRFVRIEPLLAPWHQELMASFVARLGPTPMRSALELALQSEHPLRAFTSALVIDEAIAAEYSEFRLVAVTQVIHEWLSANGLEVDVSTPRPTLTTQDEPVALSVPEEARLEAVRRLVHKAIDRMTVEDLNRLQVPVQFFVES